MAAKGPGRLFRLSDGSPERLEGGHENELLRYGGVVVGLVADLLCSLTGKARGKPYDPRYVEHLLRALEQLDA